MNRSGVLQHAVPGGDTLREAPEPAEDGQPGQRRPAEAIDAQVVRLDGPSDEEPEPETVPMHGREPDRGLPEDEDMIVVEDGYEETQVPDAAPIIPVRRQEYRQLFARLRRG